MESENEKIIALLTSVKGVLQWMCFFLILITFNTCSMTEILGDAV